MDDPNLLDNQWQGVEVSFNLLDFNSLNGGTFSATEKVGRRDVTVLCRPGRL